VGLGCRADRGARRFRRGVGLWLRDAEDGHDPARSGDLDLGDQRFDEGLRWLWLPAGMTSLM
jgi:hypothetical protein